MQRRGPGLTLGNPGVFWKREFDHCAFSLSFIIPVPGCSYLDGIETPLDSHERFVKTINTVFESTEVSIPTSWFSTDAMRPVRSRNRSTRVSSLHRLGKVFVVVGFSGSSVPSIHPRLRFDVLHVVGHRVGVHRPVIDCHLTGG